MIKLETMKQTQSTRTEKKTVSLEKELLLQEIEREFRSSESAFFGRFERLSVQEMSELRRSLERVSRRNLVVKQSLLKKILEKMGLTEATRWLEGSVLVTFGGQEPQLISKALVEFVKAHGNLQLRGLIYGGKVYEESFVRELAKLPSHRELLTLAVIRLKSPLMNLARVLSGLLRCLVTVLNEVQKKRASETVS